MGYRWRSVKNHQPYVDSAFAISSRQLFSKKLITQSLKGKVIWSIDESGFNDSNGMGKGWVQKGMCKKKSSLKRFKNITLITASSNEGDHWYSMLKGTNTSTTWCDFLRQFVTFLDQKRPAWR